MEVDTFRAAILNDLFGRLDGAVNTDRVPWHTRTFTNYEQTDHLGTFRRRVRIHDTTRRVSAMGNRFVRLVESSVAQVISEERRRRERHAIHTYDEFVSCLFERGVAVARATLDPIHEEKTGENTHMTLVRKAISAIWVLLGARGWHLEPFQWRYLQCFLLGMFKRLIGSETNRYIHEVLRLLYLATPEMLAYDPKFPNPRVADEMRQIFESMSRKMWVMVALRRSGKSVSVDLAIALAMAFTERDIHVLLMANTLDAARLHLQPVHDHLATLQRLNLVHDTRLSKNDRDVTIVFLRKKIKSIFHIIAGTPHVSTINFLYYLIHVITSKSCVMFTRSILQQQPQQQPRSSQLFSFDLETNRNDPYIRTFVFTSEISPGWNMFPLSDCSLPDDSLLLVDHVEVLGKDVCGLPYVVRHDDGRLVGRRTTHLQNCGATKPTWFPVWADWKTSVHGLCGADSLQRKQHTGDIEALNEERFYLSNWYLALSEYLRSQDTGETKYKQSKWNSQVELHIPPRYIHKICNESILECLKKRYLECPIVKTHSSGLIADLCIYLHNHRDQDTKALKFITVTVQGQHISRSCEPTQILNQGSHAINQFLSFTGKMYFDDVFRTMPIEFHRDRSAF